MKPTARRLGEFELIDRYFKPLAADPGAFGLADDAALVTAPPGEELVVTTDLVAAGIHFFPDDPPEAIARKALRVNLSDLAAKGAEPFGYLVALALPQDWSESWIRKFARGLKADQQSLGISLLGGDTSRAAGGLTIAITAIGRLPKGTMVHRGGARAGDVVFVSGTIGDAALGLRLRLGEIDRRVAGADARHLLDRYLNPRPRLELAPVIRRYATAAMDVSDGLVGDFKHICEASKLTGDILAADVPLSKAARRLVEADPAALRTVLTGGDDYEILATVPPDRARAFTREAEAAGVPVHEIGRMRRGRSAPQVIGLDGKPIVLATASFDHFSRK